MKSSPILFTFLLASTALFAQDQATDVQVEDIVWEATHFNHEILENDSIQQLTKFLMHEYREAEALLKKGIIVKDIVGFCLLRFLLGSLETMSDMVEKSVCLLIILAGATFIAGNVMIPTGYVFKGKGTHRMKFLTDQLNQLDYPEAFSIHITPTLMQYETPQTQNNIGMGLSLSIGF